MSNKRTSVGIKLASSAVVSAAILVAGVLPAEYGIDPTGIGKVTGLTELSSRVPVVQNVDYGQQLEFNIEDYDSTAETIDRDIKGLITRHEQPFQTKTIDIDIEDLGEVEYKFIMREDMAFVYSWKIQQPKGEGVYYDFHGHPQAADVDKYPEGFEMAYSKSEGTQQSGSFVAPFDGLHGFYFMNLEEGPITVELSVSGYFEDDMEVYRAVDGQVLVNREL